MLTPTCWLVGYLAYLVIPAVRTKFNIPCERKRMPLKTQGIVASRMTVFKR